MLGNAKGLCNVRIEEWPLTLATWRLLCYQQEQIQCQGGDQGPAGAGSGETVKEALDQSSHCDGAQKMELQLQEDVGPRKGVAFLEIGDRKVHVYDSIVQWRQKN